MKKVDRWAALAAALEGRQLQPMLRGMPVG